MILATKAIAYISVYTLCYIVLPFGIVLSVYATIRFPLWDHQIPVCVLSNNSGSGYLTRFATFHHIPVCEFHNSRDGGDVIGYRRDYRTPAGTLQRAARYMHFVMIGMEPAGSGVTWCMHVPYRVHDGRGALAI